MNTQKITATIGTCYLCKKGIEPGQTWLNADSFQVGALRGNKYPPMSSPRYDLRYGVAVHDDCYEAHMAKKEERSAPQWIIFDLDGVIDEVYGYHEARNIVLCRHDDGRMQPEFKRIKAGLYEYWQSTLYPSDQPRGHCWIGRKSVIRQEFGSEMIEEYEKEKVKQ